MRLGPGGAQSFLNPAKQRFQIEDKRIPKESMRVSAYWNQAA